MKTVELNYYVDFGTGDGSDWLDWEVDLNDEEEKDYDKFGNAQFLCYFLHSHKACVFHFITPFVWV